MQMFTPQQPRQSTPNAHHYQARPAGQIPSMDFGFWFKALPPTPTASLSLKSKPTASFESPLLHTKTQGETEEREISDSGQRNLYPALVEKQEKVEALMERCVGPGERQISALPAELLGRPTLVPETYSPQSRFYRTEPIVLIPEQAVPSVELQPFSQSQVPAEELELEGNEPIEDQTAASLPESEIRTLPPALVSCQSNANTATNYHHLVGKLISVDIEARETIGSLKARIFARTGLPIRLQQLFFNGQELVDAFTLDIYSILPESTLFIHLPYDSAANSEQIPAAEHWTTQLLPPPVLHRIQISVKMSSGSVISLSVDPRSSISFLKKQIEASSGLQTAQQLLLLDNRRLSDYRCLADYSVNSGALLHLNVRAAGGMTLFIGFCFNSLDSLSITRLERIPASQISFMVLKPGLSFISKCKSEGCKAYRQSITVNKGFGLFDLARISGHLSCPICETGAEVATNCGFFQAKWVFEGQLADQTDIRREGKAETDHYYSYKEGDNMQWRYLQVTVSPLARN